MLTVTLAYAVAHLAELLDKVEAGEEVLITREGRPAAHMRQAVSPAEPLEDSVASRKPLDLEALAALRATLPPWGKDNATLLREMRDED